MSIKNKYTVQPINTFQCKDWLLGKHYAKRMPSISYAFGLYENSQLIGILTIGKPPSPPLCVGVCGVEYAEFVFELNRLCVNDGLQKNTLSYFVGKVLKQIKDNLILVSYADTSQGHHGYIYQATNWIYTGISAKRTEWREIGVNTHSKSVCDKTAISDMREQPEKFHLIERARKHRYLYFTGKRAKEFRKFLKYEVQSYPKGDNQRYDASYQPITQGVLF